jgi:hypothetical protein
VNEDELAKRVVMGFYRTQNEAMYGKEKEVGGDPQALSSNLKYGIDSLFENFRNSVEQILSADYNGDLTQQKGYEVIKKYNQLSSYLKNVINIKALSKEDQDALEKQFDDMKDKLLLLKRIANDNNFIDKDDISNMVDTILKLKQTKEIEKISGKSPGMIEAVKGKSDSVKQIEDSINNLAYIDKLLQQPPQEIQNSTKFPDWEKEYKILFDIFNDPDLNPLEFATVQSNYDAVNILKNDIDSDIKWVIDIKQKLNDSNAFIQDILTKKLKFPELVVTKIKQRIAKAIEKTWEQLKSAKEVEMKTATDQIQKNIIIKKYNLEFSKLKGTPIDDLGNDEVKERDDRYKNDFKSVDADLQKTNTYNNNLDALDPSQLLDEEREMNKILTDVETIKTNILATLENMTDTYMNTIKYVTPSAPVVAVAPVAVKAVTSAPKKVNVTVPQEPIYKTYESFKKKFEKTVDDYIINQGNYTNFNDDSKHHMRIKSRWKNYQTLSDADKRVYFK